MQSSTEKWIEQGKKLLQMGMTATYEVPSFAISMLTYFYGPSSAQVRAYQQTADNVYKDKFKGPAHQLFMYARGAISSTITELENGLVGSIRLSVEGELLGDLIGLSKEALAENTEDTKNVAAVLAAAAFEDCLRRLASEKAGVTDRPKLEKLLGHLKDANLIKGGNVSLATSMLKFRNDSLHADFSNVTRAQIEGCLSLTQSLLQEHFS